MIQNKQMYIFNFPSKTLGQWFLTSGIILNNFICIYIYCTLLQNSWWSVASQKFCQMVSH